MTRIDKLFVLWVSKPGRRVIGTLSRTPGEFVFRYEDDLGEVERAGVEGLVGFPLPKREFRSPHPFAAFSHRIPSPARSGFRALVEEGAWRIPTTLRDLVPQRWAAGDGSTRTRRVPRWE